MLGDERPDSVSGDVEDNSRVSHASPRTRTNKLKEQPVEQTQNVGLDMEQVFALIGKMDENNQKNLLATIAEMKKPTPAEQAKLDKEELKLKSQQESRLKIALAEEQRKKNNASYCRHATVHPGTGVVKHSWRAQVHTPHGEKAFFVPTCQICWTQSPKILATPDMLTQGVNLDQYSQIDYEVLKNWAKSAEAAA